MIININNFKETVREEAINRNGKEFFSHKHIDQSIEHYCKLNLRYNLKKGITYIDNIGVVSKYTSDTPSYNGVYEAAVWEFTCWIRNGASMLSRGYELK